MLTYTLKKAPGMPLYEALYRCIREDIITGVLQPGARLPSKRALAENLEVSKITVEGAYEQLAADGYIRAVERVGYFVEAVERKPAKQILPVSMPKQPTYLLDLTANGSTDFPFSVWNKLQREVMLDLQEQLLLPVPNQGIWELRCAIAEHLSGFRGMQVQPENILVGAGTDFLYNLLIQLLGRDKIFAIEEPGYDKIRKIYEAGGASCVSAQMDMYGVIPQTLGSAQVLHLSPAHHFPTGLITPMSRRMELISWMQAEQDRYIIEDDYDSEFRFDAHPMPTMESLDRQSRVIYMNTFSKTLVPSIRISYMVLPEPLMVRFRETLGFYSCTVPSFEQYTLARFLHRGYFEKHLNRMRKAYKARRNSVMAVLQQSLPAGKFRILEQNAGLHFLLQAATTEAETELVAQWEAKGIRVRSLESYYREGQPLQQNCLVINYSSLTPEKIQQLSQLLQLTTE